MRSKIWKIKVNKKEMLVTSSTSSAAVKKALVDLRKQRGDRDLNHGEVVKMEVTKSTRRVLKLWQQMGKKVIL